MIRFNVILSVVIVAVGLLIAGAVSGSLLLVDSAIGVAALAVILLVVMVVVGRQEIFGETTARVAATGPIGVAAGQAAPRNGSPASEHELPVGFSADGQLASTRVSPAAQTSQLAEAAQSTRPEHSAGAGRSAADQSVRLSQGERNADVPGLTGQPGRGSAQKADRPDSADADSRRRQTGPPASKPPVGGAAVARSGVGEPPKVEERRASRDSAVAEPVPAEVAPDAPAASVPAASAPAAPAPAKSAPAPAKSAPVPPTPAPVPPKPAPSRSAPAPPRAAAKAAAGASPESGSTTAPAPATAVEATAANVPDKADSPSAPSAKQPAAAASTGTQVTVVPGIARYHLPGCILIRFLGAEDLQEMTIEAAESSGCVPCKACRPDSPDK